MKKILFALLLAGCASTELVEKTDCSTESNINNDWKLLENNQVISLLPGSFTADQVDMIKIAASHWTYATGGMINFTFVTNYEYPLMYSAELNGSTVGIEWSDKSHYPVIAIDTMGLNYTDTDGIVKLNNNAFIETVMHELGHGLGLQHHNGDKILMNPSLTGIVCVDSDSIQQLCLMRLCSRGFQPSCKF